MKKISAQTYLTIPFHLFLSFIIIIFIGTLPHLFIGMKIDFNNYLHTLMDVTSKLIGADPLTYTKFAKPLFPQILIQYGNTVIIFLAALFISVLVSFMTVYALLLLPVKKRERIKSFFLLLEAIPDIFIILCLQLLVVWIYKQTNFLIANIAGTKDNSILLFPIICLSLPTILMFNKLLLLRFENELQKDYTLLARAKGFDTFYILNHHVLRNVFLSTLYFSRTNIWYMLSNLYIIEYLLNVQGIFTFLKTYNTELEPAPEIFCVTLFLIYIPIFIVFKLFNIFIPDELKGES
ncbi:peptide ABC transporter permease [Bacillus wiedmannii]|uniref:ABC transporter permease subunit n=1 Tax=Bacillus wiedmannii TaxID=1890302 RepID=UPI000BF6C25A|nr:ABC transporter permease subunit [Bacillus wiedmannii]PGD54870.1 peptide ABC transporter permease [Bacillus wiedmannii]PHA27661.1 peptide ABC transporter permease [Bacillus wiedmannii]PHB14980.1 peptide ABC transporter permease [Bacillus wiedmannii]